MIIMPCLFSENTAVVHTLLQVEQFASRKDLQCDFKKMHLQYTKTHNKSALSFESSPPPHLH